ncbi:FAD-dependent oxidoreductase [Arthrobacter sp. zg-Y877]|uniref:NAD(P)/FAD-dependent oxidoreductase n=1 Tax=Arthrobacter sp. zg-Y877 TaxID=3049074 RepID=UPI0025A3F1AE|nr:FAD-dependent oxidoreductase [Arthrobacter sp. zg-Y877]MDM7990438.1 FAD-dependent oxidoreductase [Arthrobacter sp. zg-Y877]
MSQAEAETRHEDLECEVLVIGGGIAGLSLAGELASRLGASQGASGNEAARVVLVEAEPTLGYHTSSRSARQLIPSYGPPAIQDLTLRTLALIRAAEARLPEPILAPRRFLLIGDEETVRDRASAHMHPVMQAEALGLAPELRPEAFTAAGLDTTSVACNTDALLEYHRARLAAAGGRVLTGRRVESARRTGEGDAQRWEVRSAGTRFQARVVVNAAGAWADTIAGIFGAEPLALTPYRRTAAVVDVERPLEAGAPMVADAADRFYYRPEGGQVLISPAEREPSVAEDARHRDTEVQALVDLINSVTTMGITGVSRAWTGLRTEAPDGLPVVGWDPTVPGFFWLAGQGGYGFQTSSAIAELAAGILCGESVGNGPAEALSPARSRV